MTAHNGRHCGRVFFFCENVPFLVTVGPAWTTAASAATAAMNAKVRLKPMVSDRRGWLMDEMRRDGKDGMKRRRRRARRMAEGASACELASPQVQQPKGAACTLGAVRGSLQVSGEWGMGQSWSASFHPLRRACVCMLPPWKRAICDQSVARRLQEKWADYERATQRMSFTSPCLTCWMPV